MTNQPLYKDATYSPLERANDLLAQMTLEEKLAQLGSYWVYQLLDGVIFSPEKTANLLSKGIGHITRLGGASNLKPQELAVLANQIQKYLVEETRLGIPAVIHEECCSGYMAREATVFPQAIGVASTWSPELVEAMGDVIRVQMRSVGAHHALAPVLDVARDARWGRVEETFGEDPYLVACLGSAYIKGIQGRDWRQGVVATGKHFVGYSVTEGGMNWSPAHFGWREMREVYLHPFEAAIQEVNLGSIMNAYHEMDGIPCAGSKELLTDILREEWGFAGTVVSDYFAVTMLTEYHHVTQTKSEAAGIALAAGIDIELPFTDCFGEPLQTAVEEGKIPVELVDRAVLRALLQKFELGIFEKPYVEAEVVAFDTTEQRQLAREIAQKSIILLKNEGNLLPLNKTLESIAVIGPNADSVRNLFGDYAYPAHIETLLEQHSNNVFNQPLPDNVDSADGFIPAISVLQAIKEAVSPQTQVHYAKGCEIIGDSTDGFAEAVEVARQAQIAVVVVGDKAGLTNDCTSGEARDRSDLTLAGVQAQLVEAIYQTGTPIVLVLVNGRPISLEWMAEDIPAILETWFPSEEGANAIADVLFGDVNPGGKLPITFPRNVGQVPIFYGHRPSGGRSYWKEDYVESSSKPLYPFGYGLSYTQFEFSNLQVSPTAQANGEVTIQVDVKNVGNCAGDEVVQLYTRQEVSLMTRPLKELKGFKRVTLQPQQTQTITFNLPVNQLGFYNLNYQFVVEAGKVDVMVGNSSQDIHCRGSFVILNSATDADKVFFSRVEVS